MEPNWHHDICEEQRKITAAQWEWGFLTGHGAAPITCALFLGTSMSENECDYVCLSLISETHHSAIRDCQGWPLTNLTNQSLDYLVYLRFVKHAL